MRKLETIHRIVLYIDDLDRCPPEKVAEVLQAIHLILAFPLFVVVVGVDIRWVSKSLIKKYGSMFGRLKSAKKEDDLTYLLETDSYLGYKHQATPYDYLEKIFQIPFKLKPMTERDKSNYIGKLLESDLKGSEENSFK